MSARSDAASWLVPIPGVGALELAELRHCPGGPAPHPPGGPDVSKLAVDAVVAWRQAMADLGAHRRFTRSYRPQNNGKAERFNRTLADEWAYVRPFDSSAERTAALPGWPHTYNHHRSHTALGGQPPISRTTVNNGAGHYT